MRTLRHAMMFVAAIAVTVSRCAPAVGQEAPDVAPGEAAEPATIDGCQVVARIDGQVVLACEVLWQVNRLLENNRANIPPQDFEIVRQQLMKRHVAQLVDTKLLYHEFVRAVPTENLPKIEENLIKPFEEIEEPKLMKQLNVNSRRELERELTRLGSSVADARRAFNERAIAGEWIRTKIKINEEVTPDELVNYYREHAAEYDYPAQARWEELTFRKSQFASPAEAYAAIAHLGNEAWRLAQAGAAASQPILTELAKARSHGLNAKDGGLYDWTTKGALKAAAIDEAIFALEIGRLSPILETETAFHIVRVVERKDAGRKPFTEVQNDIRDRLKDERFRAAAEKYIAQLREDARIWTVYTGPVSADVLLGRAPGGAQQR